ncbi:dolichyl-P-Man:Man(5)GlcNAc(2)-PP-dolichyl mannosyltransferase [Gymnopilus junonius]|uniref:Dol-P-Man:Man(5)GlcNAc(2)-PP-Dol alpha-1,3-mannosyltransferase n=1 Tax=Gymnopilus junonius TaxID=109634 RepID=A0A9P5TSI0_GYMJU|nr:dolichyl-P-Man:Man(5)GlcNAc(2)-PP-dolichyl mannosyltransferase [Gymnopilus junonius]
MSSFLQRCLRVPHSLLFDPKYFWYLATLVIIGDALFTGLIIRFVPYTEIDWETYMIQTKAFLHGQHNYSLITGPTGPLVYPAGHVRIHQFLYDVTDTGKSVRLAQYIYGVLYLTSLVLCCGIYRSAANVPNWIIALLPLSKRLHSIYVLRLFNDCWSVVAVQAAILAFQNDLYDTGIMLFSAALSVKMSVLLYLPGLLVILFKRKGLIPMLGYMFILVVIQVLFAIPFLHEDALAYAQSAFDFGRVFLYKWTVNWRFFDEEIFLSPRLATTLLIGHVTTLIAFGLFKWCSPDGGLYPVLARGLKRPLRPAGLSPITADYIATVLFSSNLIGILFARSLHYQFYSWYAQQIPFLAWRTRYPLPAKLALLLGIEYAWNIFPSTSLSSGVLLCCNLLLLAGVWFGYPNGKSFRRS